MTAIQTSPVPVRTQQIVPAQAEAILAGLDIKQIGAVFAQSGYFADAREASQCMVKVLAGQEMGIPPFQAMVGIHLIKGKPSLHYTLIGAKVKSSGKYDYRVLRLDDTGCELEFYQNGKPIGKSGFSAHDAAKAGLGGSDNYRKYPRNMYLARAMANGVRWYCPDVFSAPVYVPEELGLEVEAETAAPQASTPTPPRKQTANLNEALGIDQPAEAPAPTVIDQAHEPEPDFSDYTRWQEAIAGVAMDKGITPDELSKKLRDKLDKQNPPIAAAFQSPPAFRVQFWRWLSKHPAREKPPAGDLHTELDAKFPSQQ